MAVFPTHSRLQEVMQLHQCQVRGNQQAPPDWWVPAKQVDPDLTDLLRATAAYFRGLVNAGVAGSRGKFDSRR